MGQKENLTVELCRKHLNENVFKLLSEEYRKKHPNWPGSVGVELESIPLVMNSNGSVLPMPLQGEENSSEFYLKKIAEKSDWKIIYARDNKTMTGVSRSNGEGLTFEPGGQIEVASPPFECLTDALSYVREAQSLLDGAFESDESKLVQFGANPWHSVEDIGLQMTKPRYRAMNKYFSSIGSYGARMMRQTCTIQMNVDFGATDEVLAKRYLASQLIAPYATAVFANSPYIDGKATEYKSFRSVTWQNLDTSRTGFPELQSIAKNMDKNSCVESYLNYSLDARVVFIEKLDFETPANLTMRQWIESGYKNTYPNMDDFKTHLTLLFPEVRPKGFIEFRSIDCQSRVWQDVPAGYYTGLMYCDRVLDKVFELLMSKIKELPSLIKRSSYGLNRDDEFSKTAVEVFKLSMEGFGSLPDCYHKNMGCKVIESYFDIFVSNFRTPADDLLKKSGDNQVISWQNYKLLCEEWSEILAR